MRGLFSAVITILYIKSFEQQSLTTYPTNLKIWKFYVDNTFSILDRGNVDSIIEHLNNQQPSICFITETENDCKLTFLVTAVSREPGGRPTTGVYRKMIN